MAAEHEGYRACKRCRPNSDSIADSRLAAIRKACALVETADGPPSIKEIAGSVGMSVSHFHRQFKELVGVTPLEYSAGRRVKRLQEKLRAGGRVTDAIYDAGYGSGSRAYAASKKTLGMTHSRYRSGGADINIDYAMAKSALGWLLVAATDDGICSIEFADKKNELESQLRQRFSEARISKGSQVLQEWVSIIASFVETPDRSLDLPLHVQGTAFQRRVWRALQAIPRGETASYKDVARAIGQPDAVRAVAQACGANKLAVAIPCHRVVRSNGELGGYHWGTRRKRELLKRESATTAERKRADS